LIVSTPFLSLKKKGSSVFRDARNQLLVSITINGYFFSAHNLLNLRKLYSVYICVLKFRNHMKRGIVGLLLLFIVWGCSQEEDALDITDIKNYKVKEVVLSDMRIGGDYITAMNFDYSGEKVSAVKWTHSSALDGYSYSYTEQRFYRPDGELDFLNTNTVNGVWNVAYKYKDGLLASIDFKKSSNATVVTTFKEYNGTKPVLVDDLYAVFGVIQGATVYPKQTTFQFDAAGDLIVQKNINIPGFPSTVHERRTTYTTELNPLKDLIKMPLPQAIEYYDDMAYYFSAHLPKSVESNYPYVDPIYNNITFEYEKDKYGRVIQIKALSPDSNGGAMRYKLSVSYY
jgi:hypothetical protein